MKRMIRGLVICAAALTPPGALAQRAPGFHSNDDSTFLALREASRADEAARSVELAARLDGYPLASYVEYYRLRPRLVKAPVAEIRDFLARHEGSRIADRLRNDWLLELGRVRDWAVFDEQYPLFALNDDLQVKCYAAMSQAEKGRNVADTARAILASPQGYGEACPWLISMLAQNGQFTADDVWAQIRMAAEAGSTSLLRRLVHLTDTPEKALLQAVDRPGLVLARDPGKKRDSQELFVIALGRAARTNVEQAVNALLKVEKQLPAAVRHLAWSQIALQAGQKLMPEAEDYWLRAGDAPLSAEGHQWKARTALRAGDWRLVQAAIDAMPASLRSDPAWTYWLGRAIRSQGRPEEATQLFEAIRSQPGFYGQLATEELGQRIVIPPQAAPSTQEELAQAAMQPGFKRAMKFLDLGLRTEAEREWNWQTRGMSERQLLAAAEVARQNGLLDRMVYTSDRTKTEFDFTQRFPAPYAEFMQGATQALGLDKAWVYGLIRQESRFVTVARSHVGASGLMQLMPATARYVARQIGMRGYHHGQVNDIETNIMLGTKYLSMVLEKLDGSQTLATAAYNAGPGRPRAWRSTLPRTVEGAIFAETIPFSETRGYVKHVMSNATYYAALFEKRPQSLKARLGQVSPKGLDETDLGDLP